MKESELLIPNTLDRPKKMLMWDMDVALLGIIGMGVGIVASIAFEDERDTSLRALDAGVLFGIHLTKLAVRRGGYLRSYVYAFIESFAPSLSRQLVEKTLLEPGAGANYDI